MNQLEISGIGHNAKVTVVDVYGNKHDIGCVQRVDVTTEGTTVIFPSSDGLSPDLEDRIAQYMSKVASTGANVIRLSRKKLKVLERLADVTRRLA
jgi:hypothetical protein